MAEEMNEGGEIESQATDTATPSESTADSYESAAENPEILAAFERTFNKGAASEGEGEEPTAEDSAEEPAEEPAAEEEGEEKPAAQKTAPKPQAKQLGKEATQAATLPPALMQAARRAKWSEEQIQKFVAADPQLAEQTFANLHGAFNDLSTRYAQLGSRRQPQQQQQPSQQAQTAQQQAAATLDTLYQQLNAFAENNGSEIVDKLIKPLYAEVIQPFRQMQAAYQAQTQAAMRSEIENVIKSFGDERYGAPGKLDVQQNAARQQLAMVADQIRSGANLQGIDMPVSEALDRAHGLLTAGQVKQTARKEIAGQVQKRGRGITNRPTQRRESRTADDGAQRGDKAAIAAVEDFWASRGL